MPAPVLRSRRRALALWLAVVVPLLLFTALAILANHDGGPGLDRALADRFSSWNDTRFGSVVDSLMDLMTPVGASLVLLVVLALLALRQRRSALFWTLAVGGAFVLGEVLKELFRRQSPLGAGHGYSFPSGTALTTMAACAAAVALALPSRVRWLVVAAGVVVAGLVGFAIAFLEWHYVSDVVAGWCLGLAWVTALWLALRTRTPRGERARAGSLDSLDGRASRKGVGVPRPVALGSHEAEDQLSHRR
jgi:membrane-associated phospholipid phosphatase